MMRFAVGVLTAISLVFPSLSRGAIPQTDRIARIEAAMTPTVHVKGRSPQTQTLTGQMAAHHVPAISIAVVDHGKIVWAKAYGLADAETGREATTRTLFQAGSISKPVAASGAMRLIQASLLDLDTPVNHQLHSWTIPENEFTKDHPVTLRHLLTHTGGLTVHGFPGYAAGAPVPSVVQVLQGRPPANTPAVVVEHEPGAVWNYSGGGMTVAQLLMTDVTHQSFPDLMRQRVLAPLGMTDSTYEQPLSPARAAAAATGYLESGLPIEGRFHTYPEMAAAGLWTTPTDLAKWAIALERAYDGSSSLLMSRKSAQAMLTPGLAHWGLGIETGGSGRDFYFTHGGDDAGFKAILMAWPSDRRAIVAMANGDDGVVVVEELMQAVAQDYGWKGLEPKEIAPVALSDAQAKEMALTYGHGQVVISATGPALSITYAGQRAELIALGSDAFLADPGGSNIDVKIDRGPRGEVKTLTAKGVTLSRDP